MQGMVIFLKSPRRTSLTIDMADERGDFVCQPSGLLYILSMVHSECMILAIRSL